MLEQSSVFDSGWRGWSVVLRGSEPQMGCGMNNEIVKGENLKVDPLHQCKTKADLQAEYIRIFMMCSVSIANIDKLSCFRICGVPLSPQQILSAAPSIKNATYQDLVLRPEKSMPKFDQAPEDYSFALAIVENKPVFAGDVIFLKPHAVVYKADALPYDPPRAQLSPKTIKGRNEVTVLPDSNSHDLHISFGETSFLKQSFFGEAYQERSLPVTGRVSAHSLTWAQWKNTEEYEEPHLIRQQWDASKDLGKELKELVVFIMGFLIVGSIIVFGIPAILMFFRLLRY